MRSADGGEDLVALAVPVAVVDLLEVVEVEHDRRQRRQRAVAWATIRLSVSSVARLFGRPVSESLLARNSASARFRRLASIGRGLGHRVADPASSSAVGGRSGRHQHRADDLAADEQRLAGRRPARARSRCRRSSSGAGCRRRGRSWRRGRRRRRGARRPSSRSAERRRAEGCRGLELVGAVVAPQDDDAAARDRSFEVPLDQIVGLVLGLGDLQRVDELGLRRLHLRLDLALGDHGVQRVAELGELVAAPRCQDVGGPPGGHLGGEAGVAADPGDELPDEDGDHGEAEDEDDQRRRPRARPWSSGRWRRRPAGWSPRAPTRGRACVPRAR